MTESFREKKIENNPSKLSEGAAENDAQPFSESPGIDELRNILREAHEIDLLGTNKKIVAFARHLRENHPDYLHYRLYHFFVGSTPNYEMCDKYDFSGEDSVEAFVRDLVARRGAQPDFLPGPSKKVMETTKEE